MHNKTFYQDDIITGGVHYRVTAQQCTGCYKVGVRIINGEWTVSGFEAYADSLATLHYEAIMAGLEKYPVDVRFAARAGIALLQLAALRLELGMAEANQ